MNMSEKRMSGICKWIFAAVIFVVIAGLLFFLVKQLQDTAKIPYEENRKMIEALETEDFSETEKAIKSLENREKAEKGEIDRDGNVVIRDEIELKRAFQGTVIVGDSFAESITEYGFLDGDVVVHKRGCSISQADELLEKTISLRPTVVFFIFGSNDLEICEGDSELFVREYEKQLETVKTALPDAELGINSILPCSEKAVDEIPEYSYYTQFNEALKQMCLENGYVYMDCDFLVADQEEIYEPDGVHVVKDCYPKWLSYLADMAGI